MMLPWHPDGRGRFTCTRNDLSLVFIYWSHVEDYVYVSSVTVESLSNVTKQ